MTEISSSEQKGKTPGPLPDLEVVPRAKRRGARVLMPHGGTIFQSGDHVTAFLRRKNRQQFTSTLCKQGVLSSYEDSVGVL